MNEIMHERMNEWHETTCCVWFWFEMKQWMLNWNEWANEIGNEINAWKEMKWNEMNGLMHSDARMHEWNQWNACNDEINEMNDKVKVSMQERIQMTWKVMKWNDMSEMATWKKWKWVKWTTWMKRMKRMRWMRKNEQMTEWKNERDEHMKWHDIANIVATSV